MTFIQSILLGLLQGLTEFLPVSSSGHLVLAKALFHINTGNDISFEVFVHFGTFLAVVLVFRDDILRIALVLIQGLRHPLQLKTFYRNSEMFRLAIYIVLGCIPAGVIGVKFDQMIEQTFSDPKMVSDLLLVTGLILFLTRYAKTVGEKQLSVLSSLGIGIAQAFAILPGISRSGTTISAGLIAGIPQRDAARFSFLMALPVIFGATLLKAKHLITEHPSMLQVEVLLAGTVVAFLGGYVALRLLFGILRRGKFYHFSFYCFLIGILGILFIE